MELKSNFLDFFNLIRLNIKKLWIRKYNLIAIICVWLVINIGLVIFFRFQANMSSNVDKNATISLFTLTIYFNNFYLLWITTYLQINLYNNATSKGLISLERRYGYKNRHIFFSRLLCIILLIVIMNLIMMFIGTLTLINSNDYLSWLLNRSVKTYFVLILTTMISTFFMMLVFAYCKTIIAMIIIVFTNILLMFFATTRQDFFRNSNDSYLSSKTFELERSANFYKTTKNSGLDQIYNVKNYVDKKLQNDNIFIGFNYYFTNEFATMSERRFWQMGQVLNTDIEKVGGNSNEQYLLYQINSQLFDFFVEFQIALEGYTSDSKLTETLFSETQNLRVKIPDLETFLNHLQTRTTFWNKYKTIFSLLLKDLKLQYKFGIWWKNNNQNQTQLTTILDDSPFATQMKSNKLYESAPEFCIIAQAFMSHWFNIVESSVIKNNLVNIELGIKIIDVKNVASYNKKIFANSIFQFPKWWLMLNTFDSWTNIYENTYLSAYFLKSQTTDLISFEKIFKEEYYQNSNFYEVPFLENVQIKKINDRWKILTIIYLLMIAIGIILLGVVLWRFKYNYKL